MLKFRYFMGVIILLSPVFATNAMKSGGLTARKAIEYILPVEIESLPGNEVFELDYDKNLYKGLEKFKVTGQEPEKSGKTISIRRVISPGEIVRLGFAAELGEQLVIKTPGGLVSLERAEILNPIIDQLVLKPEAKKLGNLISHLNGKGFLLRLTKNPANFSFEPALVDVTTTIRHENDQPLLITQVFPGLIHRGHLNAGQVNPAALTGTQGRYILGLPTENYKTEKQDSEQSVDEFAARFADLSLYANLDRRQAMTLLNIINKAEAVVTAQ